MIVQSQLKKNIVKHIQKENLLLKNVFFFLNMFNNVFLYLAMSQHVFKGNIKLLRGL